MGAGANCTGGREVLVIGAGIVGICCACCLQRQGFEVTVVDRLGPGEATSYGNAGGVATGEIIPLAVPGVLGELPGWLLDPLGPLAVRWRYLPQALPWLVRFLRAGSKERVRALAEALAALSHAARPPFEQLLAAAGLDDLLAREDCLYLYDHERQLAGNGCTGTCAAPTASRSSGSRVKRSASSSRTSRGISRSASGCPAGTT